MVTPAVVDEIRYPVGEFRIDPDVTPRKRKLWIEQMAEAPAKLRTALLGLSEEQLDTRYRQDGWTLRQVVQSPGRCPVQWLHALQTCFDRGQACNQDL